MYYDFLVEQYQSLHGLDLNDLSAMYRKAAQEGEWQPLFEYLSSSYWKDSSIRDGIQGERNIQGYFNAYLHLSKLFIAHPEIEANHGYCDFFLLADTKKFSTLRHSYIIELKYLPPKATDREAKTAKEQAVEQLNKYITDTNIQSLTAGTQLHGIYLIFQQGNATEIGEI